MWSGKNPAWVGNKDGVGVSPEQSCAGVTHLTQARDGDDAVGLCVGVGDHIVGDNSEGDDGVD